MSLKKVRIGVIAMGAMALLVFGLILAWTSQQVNEAIDQSRDIERVVTGVFELNIITNDYLVRHGERAQAQWQLRYRSLAQILAEVDARYPEEGEILDRIIQGHAETQPLFSQLVIQYKGQGLSESEQRLASQLAVKAQTMVADTFRLAETARARAESAQERGSYLLMASGVIILALMATTIIVVSKSLVAKITNLQRGIEIIAAGDLDYQVGIESHDEIGALARSLNHMTPQLKESYETLVHEITERVRTEEALQEMVEEHAKALRDAKDRLVRQEKLAAVGELAGGIGHELRSPLGVISNAAYYLQTLLADTSETRREYLDIVASQVHKAEKIISDLLDLSRTHRADREETAVAQLVTEVLDKQPAQEKVAATTRIPSDLPPVFVDPMQIEQVLANLVSNACQAMPEGGTLTVSAWVEEGWVQLSVADTGVGIPRENLGKIFEPLFTTRAEGIGMGLAVVRNLVEVNGGSIQVESKEGRGSTFTVTLPTREGVP